jgi:hypothetical protein
MSNFIGDNSAPPSDWEQIAPRYRAVFEVHPSPNKRFRSEKPFSQIMSSTEWQFADRVYRAGEEIETKEWPHPSFRPLNYSAERTLSFFNNQMKSRLPRSPWHEGRLRLDNELSNAPPIFNPRPPQIKPVDLQAS